MELPRDAVLLRIFIGEDARFEHRPLYEAIVTKAREMHLAGATVLRGPMGFGHTSQIHTTKILNLSENLPVVIEIVDAQEKVDAFLPVLNGMMSSGLITLEKVQVLQYGQSSPSSNSVKVANTRDASHAASPRRRPAPHFHRRRRQI